MNIKLTQNFLTVDGKRAGIRISNGPWIPQCDPAMIKINPKKRFFPKEFRAELAILNDSDSREDYFAPDHIKLFPGDALYDQAKSLVA